MDETAGDPPGKAVDLVFDLLRDGSISGRFLWIRGGIQALRPTWD